MANLMPTRLSMGRLKISLPADTQVERAQVDMQHGEVRWFHRALGKPVEYRFPASIDPDAILVTLDGIQGWKPEVSFCPLSGPDSKPPGSLGTRNPFPAREEGFRGLGCHCFHAEQ